MHKEKVMTQRSQKVRQWIDERKDPRSAHWQGGLEDVLDIFMPGLEPGRMIPACPLNDEEFDMFLSVLEIVDLSPNLYAAFLPPAIANTLMPPESAEELNHIDKGKPSFKLLIARMGKEERLLCAEISEHAHKPGVDIFQDGALLGSYNFENQKDCLAELNKVIRVHIWQKQAWQPDDYMRYTFNWFERVLAVRKKTVSVETDYSFFHSPTLIKGSKMDVIFTLLSGVVESHLKDSENPMNEDIAAILALNDENNRETRLFDYIDNIVFQYLTVMKDCELVDFDGFTDKEMARFNRESAGTVRKLMKQISV